MEGQRNMERREEGTRKDKKKGEKMKGQKTWQEENKKMEGGIH